jgi:hypothetical protein
MSGYIGPSPVPQSIQRRQTFTATASQTTFGTSGYTDGDFIDVYLNGVKLVGGTDYTATNGSDIVLTTGAAAGDILDFVTFNSFQLNAPSFDDSLTLQNTTEEDTDGGRESTIIFKGEQSGGEVSTLAEIEAAHDGTADDEKGDLIFRTNDGSDGSAPTERLRIDSAGKVGIGGVPTYPLHLKTSDANMAYIESSHATSSNLFITNSNATVGNTANLYFAPANNVSGARISAVAREDFSVSANRTADLVFYTRNNDSFQEEVRILAEGGITFNGDTAAANALDDYEEGTWTPAITGITVTSGTFNGTYRKIGGLVSLTMRMENCTLTGSGSTITGLPFACALRTSSSGPVVYNHPLGDKPIGILIEGGTSNAYLQYNTAAAWANAPFTAGANRYIAVQMTYTTNA